MRIYAICVRLILSVGLLCGLAMAGRAQVGLGTDQDGNPIVYRETFELKGGELEDPTGEWTLPAGWETESVVKMSNGAVRKWDRRKGGYFSNVNDPQSFFPRKAGEGLHNAGFTANDAQAQAYLITPPYDLRAQQVNAPAFSFLYASMRRSEADELRLRYRLAPDQPWRDVADVTGQLMVWKQQERWERQVINIKEVFDRAGIPDAQRKTVQFAFWGLLHRGYGVCIDDVMIVDLANKRVEVHSANYQTLSGPVGEGTALNEASLLSLKVSPGSGYFLLRKFALQFKSGADYNVAHLDKVHLYRTSSPYFSAQERDYLCELKLDGGTTVVSMDWKGQEDQRNKFGSGWHYFWVVVDIKDDPGTTSLKKKVAFRLPKEAFVLAYKRNEAINENDYLYPPAAVEAGLSLTIYRTLFRTSFEDAAELAKWELGQNGDEGGWHIGELAASQPDVHLAPTMAFSGSKVLATSKVQQPDGKLYGFVEKNTVRIARLKDPINIKNFSDVRMKLRYSLGLDPQAEVAVIVKPEHEDWSEVWTAKNRKTSDPWNALPLTLTSYTTRKNSMEIGFQIDGDDVSNVGHWGAFIDEVQVLGDYVRNDVGISRIEVPGGFDFGLTTPVRVYVKNYGAERVNGPVPVRISLSNGSPDVTGSVVGPIDPEQEAFVDITGLGMVPSLTGNNEIILTAESLLAEDDDASNNGSSAVFYAFPTYQVSHTKPYPADALKRMSHWYPTATLPTLMHSWLRDNVSALLGDKLAKFRNPPYSAFVWTTGRTKCLANEQSVLTGPVLDLTGPESKQLVVTYALHGGTLRFEYRTSGGAWQRLESTAGLHSSGWYATGMAWDGGAVGNNYATATNGFVTAKVQLPMALNVGKVQFRAVFEGSAELGAAINQVQVRALQPDFAVDFDPLLLTNSTAAVDANGYVKFKIKNTGQADSKPFNCPVEISVYEHLLRQGQLPPEDYSTLDSWSDLEAMGTLRLHGQAKSTLSIEAIPKNGSVDVDPTAGSSVSALWNYPATYYVVRVRIFPERVTGVVDDDLTNNEIVRVVMPYKMPHSVFRNVHSIYKRMYVTSAPVPVAPLVLDDWYGRPLPVPGSTSVRYPRLQWSPVRSMFIERFETTGAGVLAPQSTQDFPSYPSWAVQAPMLARYTNEGKMRVRVHATRFTSANQFNSAAIPSTDTEPKSVVAYDEEVTILVDKSVAKLDWITFANNVLGSTPGGVDEREVIYGCYQDGGEHLTLRLQAKSSSVTPGTVRLQIYANGKPIEGSPFAVTQEITPNGMDYVLPAAKIPAGYSRIDAWLEGVTEPENTAQPMTVVYQVYRWKAPSPLRVLVRNVNDHEDFYQLGHDGIKYDEVSYYGNKTLELHVVPTYKVTYQWYKGEVDATGQLTDAVGNGSSVPLDEASAAYELKYEMAGGQGCAGRTSKIVVRSDDLALLNFAGPEGRPGICPAEDGTGKIVAVVYNNSRTVYKAGTQLNFKLTQPGQAAVALPPKELAEDLQGNATTTIALDDLTGLVPGTRKYKLELIDINGKPDGNASNNVLEEDVVIYERPKVYFGSDPNVDPLVVRQLFSTNSTYNLSPTSSSDVVSYAWSYQEDLGGEETLLNHRDRIYDIKGIPHDLYRVLVTNGVGCTDDATVRFIQTDFGVAGIVSPKSTCALEENLENAEVNLSNFGSKRLKPGTRIQVRFFVDDQKVGESMLELTEPMAPKDELRYTVLTPTLREKMQGKTNVTVRAEAELQDLDDLDPSNNALPFVLKAYGYPDIAVQMSSTPTGAIDVEVEDGGQYVIYDEYRRFGAQSVSGSVTYLWRFMPDAQSPPRQISIANPEVLPNDMSKTLSQGGKGTGWYQAVAENAFVCQKSMKFELVIETIDIGIADKVVAPEDACNFAEDMQLGVQLVNKSTVPIEAGQVLQLKVKDLNNNLNVSELTQEIKLETAWPVGGKLDYTFKIPKENLSISMDEVVYRFETKVSFKDATWQGYDRVPQNNVDISEVKDKADVKFNGILVEDRTHLQDVLWALPENPDPFRYDPLMPDDTNNQVTLSVQVDEPIGSPYTYTWTLDPGLVDKTPASEDRNKKRVLEGGGQVTVLVSSTQGGCERSIQGMIQGNVADIVLKKVISPTSTCWDQYQSNQGLGVSLVFENVGADHFPAGWVDDPVLDLTYTVYNAEGVSLYTRPVQTLRLVVRNPNKPEEIEFISPLLTSTGATATQTFQNLSPLTDLPGEGEYEVRFSFTLRGVKDGKTENNHREEKFTIYGAPELNLANLPNWKHDKFYMPSAEIGVDDPADLNKYQDFRWKRLPSASATWDTPGGIDYNTTPGLGKSRIAVADPGVYMVRFKDKKACVGYETKVVEFPGYIELESNAAFVSPVSACALGSEKVKLRIRNNGKQVYTKRSVPIEVELKNPDGGSPKTVQLNLEMPNDLAPNETVDLQGEELFDLSGVNRYTLEAEILVDDPDRDAAEKAVPPRASTRMRERADVRHYFTPDVPNLRALAQAEVDKVEGKSLERIPRIYAGKPVEFELDGLVAGFVPDPEQQDGLQYEWSAGSWTISKRPKESITRFNASGLYKVRVGITYREGSNDATCWAESDEVALAYASSYSLATETEPIKGQCLKDEDKQPVVVKTTVSLPEADEPLAAGSKLLLSYVVSSDGSNATQTANAEYVLDEGMQAGDSFEYTFEEKPELGPGSHKVRVTAQYQDRFEEKFTSPENVMDVMVPRVPVFKFAESVIESSTSPYTLKAPDLPDGLEYTYSWNSGEFTTQDISVREGKSYELTVTTSESCKWSDVVTVRFVVPVQWVIRGQGSVLVSLLDGSGNAVRQLANGEAVPLNSRIKVQAKPADGHEMSSVVVNKSRHKTKKEGYEAVLDVASVMNLEIAFKVKQVDPIDGVEESVLVDAYVMTPFRDVLVLYGVSGASRYEVVSQVGVVVHAGANDEGADRLEVSLPHVAEGFYLVRLYGRDGSVRTLRTVCAR